MNRQAFSDFCFRQLVELFTESQQNLHNDRKKHHIEGLLHAGVLMNVFTNGQAQLMMEQAHVEVFGETIEERQQNKTALKQAIADGNDDFIDIPAFIRQGGHSRSE